MPLGRTNAWKPGALYFPSGNLSDKTAPLFMAETFSSSLHLMTYREFPSADLIDQVIRVQSQHIIQAQDQPNAPKESTRGFLLKAYDPGTFLSLFQMGGTLTVALGPEQQVLGYVTGTPGATFRPRHPETKVVWEESQPSEWKRSAFEAGKFRYLDQIAVSSASQVRGVAQALVQTFLRETGSEPVFTAVVQHPVENLRSTQFFVRQGFTAAAQLRTPKLGNLEDVRAILFHRDGAIL